MTNDPDWPPELEALAAAPANHLVLLENDSVRVLDTRLAPGETTPVHYHRWPAVIYLLTWSDYVRRDAQGNVLSDSRITKPLAPGATFWSTPLPPQSLENVGDTELRAIAVEVKSPAPSAAKLA